MRALVVGAGAWGTALAVALARAGLDVDLEGERLYAVLDGLAVHAVTRPSALPPDRARAVLAAHLAALRDTP